MGDKLVTTSRLTRAAFRYFVLARDSPIRNATVLGLKNDYYRKVIRIARNILVLNYL